LSQINSNQPREFYVIAHNCVNFTGTKAKETHAKNGVVLQKIIVFKNISCKNCGTLNLN